MKRILKSAAILLTATVAVGLAMPDMRGRILRAAGWALVVSDSEEPADAVVISTDADGAGVLEAADLVHRGLAGRVAVFADPPGPVDREFLRRGVEYFDAAEVSIRELRALGMDSVEKIPRTVAGTEDEGRVLPAWCDEKGYRTVLFVSTRDHSRRTRRVLSRAMEGHRTRVLVRFSRYSPYDPDTWWLTREGVRTQIVESEKLLLDLLRHPLSS
jgi:hypothetical protein